MAYCDGGKNERFGRIEFAIGADVTHEVKKAVRETDEWHPIHDKKGRVTGQWAEVCFVPNAECTARKGQPYRYLAIRELVKQPHLAMDGLPFQTIAFDETTV